MRFERSERGRCSYNKRAGAGTAVSIIYVSELEQEATMHRRSRPAGGKDGLYLKAGHGGNDQ